MKRLPICCAATAVLLLGLGRSSAAPPAEAEREAVRRAALAYVEAFYELEPLKIEKNVHPEVSNRGFVPAEAGGSREVRMDFAGLKQNAASVNKEGVFPKNPIKEVAVFEVLDRIASVKVLAEWGIDYMHLAKYDGQWKVVHVLWQTYPPKP